MLNSNYHEYVLENNNDYKEFPYLFFYLLNEQKNQCYMIHDVFVVTINNWKSPLNC